jgi:glycosyl transferase family 25
VDTAIRVISLENSAERRRQFSTMAADAGIDWDFFPALRAPAAPLIYDAAAAKRRHGRALLPAEIGCYASHFKCWEWLAGAACDQAIILEDDTLVDWTMLRALAAYDFAARKIDLLRLFSTNPPPLKLLEPHFLSEHGQLTRITGIAWGTQGYLISKAAAAHFVAHAARIEQPVDFLLLRYWEHGFTPYAFYPWPVIERHTRSEISAGQREIYESVWTTRRRRASAWLRRTWFNLKAR